jgi:class 3 adenylate cyclase/tetratricopeptide (TPR) repeat protein/ABC-type dipeptide/oligopeptide/nickel transport system ATPase component
MKCPKCQFENPEGKKFCQECGLKLALICPNCKSENLATGKFCGDCGQRLENETPVEEKPIPPAESERKHVTVLFSDLSGYTAMSEKLDPEEVKEIMGRIFGEISKIIVRYEGFIEKFMGDAVLALFGVPVAHEDDPVRAIKAAREIHEMAVSLNPLYEKKIGKPLAMHTGINTGLILTGSLDMDKNIQGVLGDSINVASRLLNLARPGDIVVGPDTFHRAEGYFNFEPLDPTIVKGKAESIKPYKVISPKEDPTKTHRLSGMRAELIGRKAEMAQLQEAVTDLKQGKSSIFSIVGDAGTGKSRLIEEIRATVSSQDIQWREGHCYAYAQNIPYSPFMDLLSRVWQIQDGDSSEIVREKVESGIKYLLGNEEGVIPYIGTLYSLSYPEIEGISPELWKSRLHTGVRSILSALTRKGSTILCLEDLQWADTSSIELLRFILKDFQLTAVFIFAYRSSFSLFTSHQLPGLIKVYNEIKLQELSTSEAQAMVESLLKTEAIPSDLRKFIQTRVEGNPFYLEEAINSLIETETLIRDNGSWKLTKQINETLIPSTIQGIITARLDRLERETKRILQEASVIGRAFFYEILNRITDLKDVVDKSLNGLERLNFIKARTIQPDLEYIFKHALTQEVVYNGLLKKERQALHERIGQVIEQLFHDRLTEFYETLAYHYKQGQSLLKALDYLTKAGEKSFKRYALDESHSYFKEAFDLLSDKPDKTKEDEKRLIDLIIKWGHTHHYRADYMGLINLLKAHETLMESHADREQLVMFYSWFGLALSRRDVLVEGYRYLHKGLQIAEEIGDIKGVGYSCMWLTQVCADMGLSDEAVIYGGKAREAAHRFELDQGLSGMVLFYSAYAHFIKGDVKKTAEYGQVLLDYGRKHSDLRCIALHYNAMGMSCSSAGDFPSAIDLYKKSIQVSVDPVISHGARMLLGLCYLNTDQLKEAQSALEEVIEHSEKFGYEWVGAASQAIKGVVLIAHGDLKQGVSLYENVIRLYLENRSLWRYANCNYLMGRVYSKIAQGGGKKKDFFFTMKNIGFLIKTLPFAHKKAEEHFHIAIKTAEEIGAKSIFGQAYLELGKLHKTKGKTEKARECITNAIEAFEKCEADVFLKQGREALATLE